LYFKKKFIAAKVVRIARKTKPAECFIPPSEGRSVAVFLQGDTEKQHRYETKNRRFGIIGKTICAEIENEMYKKSFFCAALNEYSNAN